MKFRYASDLHLEFVYEQGTGFLTAKSSEHDRLTKLRDYADHLIPPLIEDSETVLLLAGDICEGWRAHTKYAGFFGRLADRFHMVLWIAGNHEYYGDRIAPYYNQRIATNVATKWENVVFMDQTRVDFPGVTVLGCTLWADCDKGNPLSTMAIANNMNDYNHITFVDKERDIYRKLRVADTMQYYHEQSSWLKTEVTRLREEQPERQIVVMTHHAPSFKSLSRRYLDRNDPLNGAYASELLATMRSVPDIWIHGHLHDPVDYEIGETRVTSNPFGYIGHQLNPHYDLFAEFHFGEQLYVS